MIPSNSNAFTGLLGHGFDLETYNICALVIHMNWMRHSRCNYHSFYLNDIEKFKRHCYDGRKITRDSFPKGYKLAIK